MSGIEPGSHVCKQQRCLVLLLWPHRCPVSCVLNSIHHLCFPGIHCCSNQHGISRNGLVGLREQGAAHYLPARGETILNLLSCQGRSTAQKRETSTILAFPTWCPVCTLWKLWEERRKCRAQGLPQSSWLLSLSTCRTQGLSSCNTLTGEVPRS